MNGTHKNILKRILIRGAVFAAVLGAAVWFGLPGRGGQKEYENSGVLLFQSMSTSASVRLYSDRKRCDFSTAFDLVRREFARVEKLCSFFDPESELSRLNASAAEKPFVCSEELWTILSASRDYWKKTRGAFDVSVAPLLELWGFHRKQGRIPSAEEIEEARKRSGMDKIRFDDKARTVFFTVPGMSLNLGGIAKGYALDCAKEALRKHCPEITSGYLDLGGNVLTFGRHDPFRAGVRDPLDPGRIFAEIPIPSGCAVATSGGYERYIEVNGKKYGHILDPRTGLPVENSLSATVVASSGMESDILSTAFYVEGPGLAAEFPSVSVLLLSSGREKTESVSVFQTGTGWIFCK